MACILAIEADPRRRRALTTLVREHVKAHLVVVESVHAAIASIGERTPDLILSPTLLSPPDEAELLSYVKQLERAPYIQMMTVPALDMLADKPAAPTTRRWLLGPVFNRRQVTVSPQYDPTMVAAQIADGLERARERRMEYAAMMAYNAAAGRTEPTTAMVLARSARQLQDVVSETTIEQQLRALPREERRVALRKRLIDVPWLSSIKLSCGDELQLINISSTGLLVETGSRLTPGSTTELHLSGPGTNMVVPVRFIRSDIARMDGMGVRFHAAAAFTKELDLANPRPRPEVAGPSPRPEELAALLGAVYSEFADSSEPAHARFAQGLRRLVGARDVQVRTGSSGSGGRETLYFDVPGDGRSRTTLQVVFDRNQDVSDAQFKLLKAAALITAAVLELEKPVGPAAERPSTMALITDRVA
jgi:CheY-like chemotaxis protein